MTTVLTVSEMGEIIRRTVKGEMFEPPKDLYPCLAEIRREAWRVFQEADNKIEAKEKYDRIKAASNQLIEARIAMVVRRYASPDRDMLFTPEEAKLAAKLRAVVFDFKWTVLSAEGMK